MNVKRVANDCSAVGTLLVILVAVVIVVAGAAAYLVLSSDKENEENPLSMDVGPGTKLEYEMIFEDLDATAHMTREFMGQSDDGSFSRTVVVMEIEGQSISTVTYDFSVNSSNFSHNIVKTGTETIVTKDGSKLLTIWEYDDGGTPVKEYVDMTSKITYRVVMSSPELGSVVANLVSYIIVSPEPYEQSKHIGKKFNYVSDESDNIFSATCVADCIDEQYGFEWTYKTGLKTEGGMYFLAQNPYVLSADAEKIGNPVSTMTKDGLKNLQKWSEDNVMGSYIYHSDVDNGLVYIFEIIYADEVYSDLKFVLESYSDV